MSTIKPQLRQRICCRSDMHALMTWALHIQGHEHHPQICALAVLEGSIHGREAVAGAGLLRLHVLCQGHPMRPVHHSNCRSTPEAKLATCCKGCSAPASHLPAQAQPTAAGEPSLPQPGWRSAGARHGLAACRTACRWSALLLRPTPAPACTATGDHVPSLPTHTHKACHHDIHATS